jgi:hypothetical protein
MYSWNTVKAFLFVGTNSIHTMKETLIFLCVEGTALLFTLVFLQFGGGVLKDNPKPCIYENACEWIKHQCQHYCEIIINRRVLIFVDFVVHLNQEYTEILLNLSQYMYNWNTVKSFTIHV